MPTPSTRTPPGGPDAGASEVIGSILMVAITVAVAGAMAALVYGAIPADEGPMRASLSGSIHEDSIGWGTGDETITLSHKGGQALPADAIAIVVEIAGAETRFTEDSSTPLDHADQDAFTATDREFSIGERWESPGLSIPEDTLVSVGLIDASVSKTIWTASFRSESCQDDADPPTAPSWTQDPSDVTTDTTGDVTARASLDDVCAGVDTSTDPHLHFRLNDGSDPAFTDAGAMTLQGGTTWESTIPDQSWTDHGGEVLEYKAVDMADRNGNTGDSELQSDLVQDITSVTSFTVEEGTSSPDPVLEAENDDGTEATFTEEEVSTSVSFTMDAEEFEDPQTNWSDEENGFISDDQYATTTNTTAIDYIVSSPDQIDTVDSVVLHAEVSITSQQNDAFNLRACFPSGECGGSSPNLGGSASDTTVTWDVTKASRHPLGNASWTESDLEALQHRITATQLGTRDGTWRVDRAWVEVAGSTEAQSLQIQGDFADVPAGSHSLEMEHRVSDETFDVQVFDWTTDTWNTRGDTLEETSSTTWTYALTSDEYDAANDRVRMRYLDRTDDDTQGQLFVDYLQVITS